MSRALGALVLLVLAAAGVAAAPAALTTIVVEARTDLPDPNFKGAVVLVMNNLGPAPAGLIVNRPTRITVSRLFPDEPRFTQIDDKVYFGGPVDLRSVSFLFRAATAPEHAV